MRRPRVVVVCNALDDVTRVERGITTDSPAASRKVFQLCAALRRAGLRPCVLSLGRGRAGASFTHFPRRVRRVAGVPVVYAPFSQLRGLSELTSLLAPPATVLRLRSSPRPTLIFYNRDPALVPTLLLATVLGFTRVLDLEDGEVASLRTGMAGWVSRRVSALYDRLCSGGALLACSGLAAATSVRPVLCYYGVAETSPALDRWSGTTVRAVLGGTLAPETGVGLLIDAVQILRSSQPSWARHLHLEVTGKGPSLAALQVLAASSLAPSMTVHGRTTDAEYRAVVDRCSIGLALKPRAGGLADTTFPSKVVELASAALLVITTDISDVRDVLGDGALYLEHDDPLELVDALRLAVEQRGEASTIAERGSRAVWARCAPGSAGKAVAEFLGVHA
jgi:hypothetical protein